MLSLQFQRNGSQLFRYPITKERMSIGRDASSDVVLTDKDISRLHCELYLQDDQLSIKDFSNGGTRINSRSIGETEISSGDTIQIGSWIIAVAPSTQSTDDDTIINSKEKTKILTQGNTSPTQRVNRLEITVKEPNCQPYSKKFRKEIISMGTMTDNDIVITDEFVSKRHCKIENSGEALSLIDLGSTNGTFYHEEKIDMIPLRQKGRFRIGMTEVEVKRLNGSQKSVFAKESKAGTMIASSKSMREIFALIKRVAPTNATVLISGESGTGKELVARSIHDESERSEGPFVAINCGAIPPNIIESELFGHEKGAFTGAAQTRRGVFEQADTGTLFLDEIGEMPFDLQTRLLRALETRTVRRIGGQRDIPVNVRVISATNQDLKKRIFENKFREDLFFRLYIVPIHIPPLRERKEDVRFLVEYFLKMFSIDGVDISISEKAMDKLASHDWKGNVRELKNTIQRTIIFNRTGNITAHDINLTKLESNGNILSLPLTGQEKGAIVDALKRSGGNRCKAALLLGIARTTLANKIKKYEIDLSSIKQ